MIGRPQHQRRKQHDHGRIQKQHEPFERSRDVDEAHEIEQAREVVADESQPGEQQPVAARDSARFRPASRPPRHRDEKRRREQHAKREQRYGIDRMPRVGELDEDRLEGKAEHAEDGARGSDPAGAGRRQSHRTSPAQAVTRISAPNAIRYHAKGTKSWCAT